MSVLLILQPVPWDKGTDKTNATINHGVNILRRGDKVAHPSLQSSHTTELTNA
jgi:hypothetical protein